MTREQMAQVMETMFAEEMKTREAGQKEYSHVDAEAFTNFNKLAEELHIDRKMVLWIYVRKHLDGILAYLNGHKSQREDVRGRIMDTRVYLALLRGMIEEEEKGQTYEVQKALQDAISTSAERVAHKVSANARPLNMVPPRATGVTGA